MWRTRVVSIAKSTLSSSLLNVSSWAHASASTSSTSTTNVHPFVHRSISLFSSLMQQRKPQHEIQSNNSNIFIGSDHTTIPSSSHAHAHDDENTQKQRVPFLVRLEKYMRRRNYKGLIFEFDNFRSRGGYLNTVHYNLAMLAHAKLNKNADSVLALLQEMTTTEHRDRARPNLDTYHIVLFTLFKAERYKEMAAIYEQMQDYQIQMDALVFEYLVAACAEEGRIAAAQEFLRDMVDHGIFPTANLYCSMIYALRRRHDYVPTVLDLLDEMPLNNVKPNIAIYSVAIKHAIRSTRNQYLHQLKQKQQQQQQQQSGDNDTATTTTTTTAAMTAAMPKSISAISAASVQLFLDDMKQRQVEPTTAFYNFIMLHYARSRDIINMKRTFSLIQRSAHLNIQPNATSYQILWYGFNLVGDKEQTDAVERVMSKKGIPVPKEGVPPRVMPHEKMLAQQKRQLRREERRKQQQQQQQQQEGAPVADQ